MSQNLIRKLFRDQRWTLLGFGLGIAAYALLITLMFPTASQNAKLMDDYMKMMPEAMLKAFGIEGSMASFTGFITAEFLNLMWVLMAAAFAISFGGAMIAKEIETGTMELLLSAPISRQRVFWSKVAVLLTGLVVVTVAGIAAIWLGAILVNVSIDVGRYVGVGLLGLAFFVAIGGFAAVLSSFADDRGRPTLIAIGITLALYLMNFVAAYWTKLEWIKYLTLFHYYQPRQILDAGVMPWGDLAVFAGTAVACLAAASLIFQRRDITV